MDDIIIEPMTAEFLVWRCLHSGPLSRGNIDQWPHGSHLPWEQYRERNVRLLEKLTEFYGACAILAHYHEEVVGQLRFYPKVVWEMPGAGGLCLQQESPGGPTDSFVHEKFPPLQELTDKTISIHCLMTGSPQQQENPFQRRGIGTRMVLTLVEWARGRGWQYLEAKAFEDLPIIYSITGSAGLRFWLKLGFTMVQRYPHPELQNQNEFVAMLERQATEHGISPEKAKEEIVIRLRLS